MCRTMLSSCALATSVSLPRGALCLIVSCRGHLGLTFSGILASPDGTSSLTSSRKRSWLDKDARNASVARTRLRRQSSAARDRQERIALHTFGPLRNRQDHAGPPIARPARHAKRPPYSLDAQGRR